MDGKKLEILNEITSDEVCSSCILKEIVLKDGKYNARLLIQLKCIEKFKWEESERRKCDIGNHEAYLVWVDKGFAEKFAKVFDEEKTVKQIYKETIT